MRPAFLFLSLAILLCAVPLPASSQSAEDQHSFTAATEGPRFSLTFEDRVRYQRAIEEVYWKHNLWPEQNHTAKPSLDQVLPPDRIKAKVEDYLRKSNALAETWQRPITAQQLQAEMDRMARNTKKPGVLRELFAALDNDPFVIAECLARPALADRLIRNWYAFDSRFHGELKQRAESELQRFGTVDQMRNLSGEYTETEWIQKSEKGATSPVNAVELDPETWREWTDRLAARYALPMDRVGAFQKNPQHEIPVGVLTQLQEDESGFSVTAVLQKQDGRIRVATVQWNKETFDSWWNQYRQKVVADIAVAPAPFQTPMISTSPCVDDTWTPTSYVPSARYNHTAVWTGTEMIIWGGFNGSLLASGGRYNPATDTWRSTTPTGAPSARNNHKTVWTGSEMIVWGGDDSAGKANTGGRYNPSTDVWSATSTSGAPSKRDGHSTVWTGNLMVVWGGWDGANLNTGGRYDPSTNTWSATSTTDAPSPRSTHTAVWTGSKMVVWGGYNGGSTYFDTGGRYDPSTDTWGATSTSGAPSGRYFHTAVWTGSRMVVWGGYGGSGPVDTGSRYDPVGDTWTATSTTLAPTARRYHTGRLDRNRDDRLGRLQQLHWRFGYRKPVRSGRRYVERYTEWTFCPVYSHGSLDRNRDDRLGRLQQLRWQSGYRKPLQPLEQ